MKVFTIGFTRRDAEDFFGAIRKEGIGRIIDVRLNNESQLSAFSKKRGLKFFLREICHVEYIHIPDLAPTKEILDEYKKHKGSWEVYEDKFLALMERRNIASSLSKEIFEGGCLLCSEREPHHCHQRLVVEYLNQKWNESLEIKHL